MTKLEILEFIVRNKGLICRDELDGIANSDDVDELIRYGYVTDEDLMSITGKGLEYLNSIF